MKKLFLFSAMILFSGMMSGQAIQKGYLVSSHAMTITLKPDVTMDQFLAFVQTKFIPELEKNLVGWKAYLIKGIRGESPNSYGLLYVIKSEKDRDRYFNDDGTENEQGKEVTKKLKPVTDEMAKLGSFETKYTDWLVQ